MEPNKPVIGKQQKRPVGPAHLDRLAKGSGSHHMEEPESVDTHFPAFPVSIRRVDTVKHLDWLAKGSGSHHMEFMGSFKRVDTVKKAVQVTGRLINGKVERREKYVIIELMLATSREPFRVIPICGGGGVGKTTLALMVYEDKRVLNFFDLRVWVYASEDFDVLSLPRSVLQYIFPSSRFDGVDLETKLQQTLSNKKFLIVLDGVCNLKREDLDQIYRLFRTGVSGSKLVVTTHDHTFSGGNEIFGVGYLSDDECWSLFAHRAFNYNGFDDDDEDYYVSDEHYVGFNVHPQLQSMGRQLVVKCSGCPLAAVVLGGLLLHTNQDPNEWEAILHAKEWETPKSKGGINPALMVSFRFLPPHLKLCFAYCSLFPKGYLFDKNELVRLWMAEGLLALKDGRPWEKVGKIYFSDLSSRSFFQRSHRHKRLFEMHDMVADLSKSVADDIFLHLKNKRGSGHEDELPPKIQHISFWKDTPNVFDRIQHSSRLNGLNTLLSLTSPDTKSHRVSISIDALYKLLYEVSSLRVLSLSYYKIRDFPVPIYLMKHLRYLNLSGTQIKCLPEWVCDLINLQTLLLAECHSLVSLPQGIGNLVNLCFLDISDTPRLKKMPVGIGCLKSLRKLGKFVVGDDKGLRIKELGNLEWLQGDLLISGLQNVEDEEDAKKANLKDKYGLDYIAMEWSSKFDGSRNGNLEMKVMNSLLPHAMMDKLTVTCYGGPAFPPWIGHPSFEHMSSIEIYECKAVESLPSLGRLPWLRDLSIRGLNCVRTVSDEFYGNGDSYGYPFPRLKTLRFEDMPEWVEWLPPDHAKGAFLPSLHVLQIVNCPKLVGQLPERMRISRLQRLEISGCASLAQFPEGEISAHALRQLIIHDCSQLECISEKLPHFSPSLAVIDFNGYTNLTSLPTYPNGLKFLVQLSIANCPHLKSFSDFQEDYVSSDSEDYVSSDSEDCVFFPKLEQLAIMKCDNLESLPNHMINLRSLRSLNISNCRRLNSLPEGGFLPPNLTSLTILECVNIHQPISEWGLEKLSYLSVLFIGAVGPPDMATFPDYLCTLPKSITKLSINRMQSLKYLGDGLLDLTSLKELQITDCPMLKYFPRDGLPPTLSAISIRNCPFLQQRCARDEGEYWRFLAYIPIVETRLGHLVL